MNGALLARTGLAIGAAGMLVVASAGSAAAGAPSPVKATNVRIGRVQIGSFGYGSTTVVNRSSSTIHILTAHGDAAGFFWPTWGGTCNNTYSYDLPANTSCTIEWGFDPGAAPSDTSTVSARVSVEYAVSVPALAELTISGTILPAPIR